MAESSICIFGAGTIGCYIGARLLAAGYRVSFIGRKKIGDIITRHGLSISDYRGHHCNIPAADIRYSEDSLSAVDAEYIFLCVKSGDSETVAMQLAKLGLGTHTIVSFQNGVRNKAIFARLLPAVEFISGMVPFNVVFQNSGHLHQGSEGRLIIGKSEKAMRLATIFSQTTIGMSVSDNIEAVQWSKLIMNLSNAVNALSGLTLLEQLQSREYRFVMAAIIEEALRVLKAANIPTRRVGKVIPQTLPFILRLPTSVFKRVARALLKIDPLARSSMYRDLQLRRPTEIDYLNGEIVQLAEALGREARLNKVLHQKIKQAELSKLGAPELSAAEILS